MSSFDLDYLTRIAVDADHAARAVNLADVTRATDVAARVEQEQDRLHRVTEPISRLIVPTIAEQATVNPLAMATRPLVELNRSLYTVSETVNSTLQAAEWLVKPLAASMPVLDSIAEQVRIAISWKPILMRWAQPPEATFATRLSEAQQTIYSAIRPDLLSFAEQLRQAYDLSSLNVFVRWMETTYALDLNFDLDLGLDLDLDLDLGAPVPDGSAVTPPPEPSSPKPRRMPDARPRPLFNTEVQRQPLIRKELVVRVARDPWVVTIGGTVIGGTILLVIEHYFLP